MVCLYMVYYELFITLSSFVCHPTIVVVVVINSKPLPKTVHLLHNIIIIIILLVIMGVQ